MKIKSFISLMILGQSAAAIAAFAIGDSGSIKHFISGWGLLLNAHINVVLVMVLNNNQNRLQKG